MPATSALNCALATSHASFTGSYNASGLPGIAPRFATPDFLFATQASKQSNRPAETITPLSRALGLDYNDKHADDDYQKVAEDILQKPKYAGKTVLVCWHHGKIPKLAEALGIPSPPAWPGTVFDRVWVIAYANGKASLANAAQMLLYGDAAS